MSRLEVMKALKCVNVLRAVPLKELIVSETEQDERTFGISET